MGKSVPISRIATRADENAAIRERIGVLAIGRLLPNGHQGTPSNHFQKSHMGAYRRRDADKSPKRTGSNKRARNVH